jgi:hypothetical protein
MLHICGVSKTFGEWHQKTNKAQVGNVHKASASAKLSAKAYLQNRCHTFLDCRCTAAIQERMTAVV